MESEPPHDRRLRTRNQQVSGRRSKRRAADAGRQVLSPAKAINMKRVDLEVAAAAGLGVAFPLYKIFTIPESDGSPNPLTPGEAAALLVALSSYLSVPLLLRLLRRRWVARPMWLWTSVVGYLLIAATLYFPGARPAE